jgi:hypothetical protein
MELNFYLSKQKHALYQRLFGQAAHRWYQNIAEKKH